MRRRGAAMVAVLSLLALPAAATAQSFGQQDPETPAGVEYALPLDQARQEAGAPAPRSQRRRRGGVREAQLFGAGIRPARAADPAGEPADVPERGEVASGQRGEPANARAAVRPPPAADVAAADRALGGVAVGVVAVGLLLGAGLRRALRERRI